MAAEKLPPQNVEAEQSVLGSLLIDQDAITKVAPFLRGSDFYREAHGTIYDAIVRLYERREPADFVTVVDELERQEQLEEVGGASYITSLINTVPTAVHVEHYGRIVERTAILRRLINAAGRIAGVAYEEAESVDEIIDRAEQILFNVSQRRVGEALVPIRDLLSDYFDRIEYLHEHRDEVIGLPTTYADLDKLLGGFQPSDLIIVAGRPGMGKTSLALSIAQQTALRFGARIAVFSLEMAGEQLAQRLISGETGIDSQRLRIGQIGETELAEVASAIGRLSDTSIFIDDTPGITPFELRTKARRLHAEQPLNLLIVDYLQLMHAGRRTENRVQEISFISRQLKALARELRVPLLAVSQLSRAVESRQDKRPILSDLRESGCLTGDSLVQLRDGRRVPIAELAEKGDPVEVLALNEETWRFEAVTAHKAWKTGVKPVFLLQTQLGREIKATANHKFRTVQGWKRLDELKPGDHIALPRSWQSVEESTNGSLSEAEASLLGHLIGDGCTLARHAVQYTTGEPELADTVAELSREVFGDAVAPRIVREQRWWQVYLTVWRSLVEPARRAAKMTTREMQAEMGMSYCGSTLYKSNLSRERASRVGRIVQSEPLVQLAISDVYWDRIAKIEGAGIEDVYDLEVPRHHNFAANDIVVHNSIEQDADVVIFIYRDEVYNEDSDQKNIAEIRVAKHRQGPTGKLFLRFVKELTKFVNLEVYRDEPEEVFL